VILDDDVAMLAAVARLLRREGFIVVATTDPRQAMEEVIRCGADAIVTDIYLHGVDGNLVLAMLATAAPKTARLVLTSETDFEAAAGMSIPFSVDAFVSKREVTGKLVSTLRLVTGFVQGDGALDRSAEARDQAAAMDMALHIMRAVSSKEDRDHASRVAAWSHRLGRAVGLGSADLLTLELGALLHDIGEVGLAQGMLDARRRLTPTELTRLHRHPDLGGAMLAGLPMLRRAIPLVRTHHER
jgi:putative two-component system response regulator